MRTKTFLLSAVVLAAGLSASVAQSVFSVNAVGYVNLTIRPGYNLIANPLNASNSSINAVIPTAPDDTVVFKWNNAAQAFGPPSVFVTGLNWATGPNFDPSPLTLAPGEGFFIQNVTATPFTITFVGEVPQGPLVNTFLPNFGFYGSIVPQSGGLNALGFPAAATDAVVSRWDTAGQRYGTPNTYVGVSAGYPGGFATGANFDPADPQVAVGEGFLLYNPPTNGQVLWNRTFTVN